MASSKGPSQKLTGKENNLSHKKVDVAATSLCATERILFSDYALLQLQ
jgi:hypothetical protein